MNTYQQYVRAVLEKRRIEAQLREANQKVAEAEFKAKALMEAEGIEAVTVDGYTVFPSRQISVKVLDHDALLDRVPAELVRRTVHHQQLQGYLREVLTDDVADRWEADRLPDSLRGIVEVSEFSRLNCRAK